MNCPETHTKMVTVETGPADSPVGFIGFIRPENAETSHAVVWSTHTHDLRIYPARCIKAAQNLGVA